MAKRRLDEVSPYLQVDINCTFCGKLMAFSNACHLLIGDKFEYLCPTCERNQTMTQPTQKAPAIEKFIDSLTPSKIGRTESIETDICSWCSEDATEFCDELSKKEYTISGLCQKCQDKTFGQPE